MHHFCMQTSGKCSQNWPCSTLRLSYYLSAAPATFPGWSLKPADRLCVTLCSGGSRFNTVWSCLRSVCRATDFCTVVQRATAAWPLPRLSTR